MSYGDLASREYKIMLQADRFGPRKKFDECGLAFWSAVREVGQEHGVVKLRKRPKWGRPDRRRVSFWDTARCQLDSCDYVLRRRLSNGKKKGAKKVKATLKKRHADRVLAADIRISKSDAIGSGPEDGDLERKFEEDIKPTDNRRQRSLFSHSLTWEDEKEDISLDSVESVEELFPGFASAVGLDFSDSLGEVRSVVVDELVLAAKEKRLQLIDAPDVGVEAALVAWYETCAELPAVVEFSYRYRGTEVDFSPAAAAGAAALLQLLSTELPEWCSAKDLTKTRWMYTGP